MVTLTTHLNDCEWRLAQAAAKTWASEEPLSTAELTRRLLLLGCMLATRCTAQELMRLGQRFHAELDRKPDSGFQILLPGKLRFSTTLGQPGEF